MLATNLATRTEPGTLHGAAPTRALMAHLLTPMPATRQHFPTAPVAVKVTLAARQCLSLCSTMAAHSSCQGTVRAPAGVTLMGTSVTTGQAAAAQLPTGEVGLAAAHWLVDLAAVACRHDLQYSASAVTLHI